MLKGVLFAELDMAKKDIEIQRVSDIWRSYFAVLEKIHAVGADT